MNKLMRFEAFYVKFKITLLLSLDSKSLDNIAGGYKEAREFYKY